MVGAVLHQELLLGSRRGRLHLFGWVYAGWLVLQVFYFLLVIHAERQAERQAEATAAATAGRPWDEFEQPDTPLSLPAVVGSRFAETFVPQQMVLLLLVTPPLVAGAVTDEKRRGTLQHLLATDLESRHIVLGKLLGRVAQVCRLALFGLPLFGLMAGFAGVRPLGLVVLAAALVMPLVALACATVLASVLCRQTRDAVLAVYGLGAIGGLAVWGLGGVLELLNPLYVLAPVWEGRADTAEAGRRLLGAVLAWGVPGAVCLALAIWRLRPSYLRELEGVHTAGPRRYGGERLPVGDDPIRWREGAVEGLAPTPTLRRVPPWAGVVAVAVATTVSSLVILVRSLPPQVTVAGLLGAMLRLQPAAAAAMLPDATTGFFVQGAAAALLASLVVGVRCSGAVTGERERQTWELLLLTPLSPAQVLRGKLWGVLGAGGWYVLAYAAPAVTLSALGGLFALFWTLVWLGVTVLATYFLGAAGLWCSVRSRSSWRSLLATLGLGYAAAACLCAAAALPSTVLAFLMLVALQLMDAALKTHMAEVAMQGLGTYLTLFVVALCLGLAAVLWLASRVLLDHAQRRVGERDRARHWSSPPLYRRSRRPAVRRPVAT